MTERCIRCGGTNSRMGMGRYPSRRVHLFYEDCFVEVVNQRDLWIHRFFKLEGAVTHHKRDAGTFADANDEALYAARDKILSDDNEGR